MNFTSAVAVYGAALSTIVFLWNVHRARSKIRVKIVGSSVEGGPGVCVSLQNFTSQTLHVTAIWILVPDHSMRPYGLPPWPVRVWRMLKYRRFDRYIGWHRYEGMMKNEAAVLPKAIAPGTSHLVHIPAEPLVRALRECNAQGFAALAQDALWRESHSGIYRSLLRQVAFSKVPTRLAA